MTNTNTFSYQLGCVDEPEDNNDLMLSNYIIPKKLPKAISWFDPTIPVLNQGAEPSCVGYSSVAMKREHEKMEIKKVINLSGQDLYERCKKIDGIPETKGTYIRVAMKLLQNEGVNDDQGNNYKIGAYTKINNVDELRYAITANGFAVIGVNVYDSFYNPKNGVVDYVEGQKVRGRHAILLGAFDDTIEKTPFKNSWGAEWGVNGFAYLTYRYIEKAMKSGWTAVDVDNEISPASGILNIGKIKSDLAEVKSK